MHGDSQYIVQLRKMTERQTAMSKGRNQQQKCKVDSSQIYSSGISWDTGSSIDGFRWHQWR